MAKLFRSAAYGVAFVYSAAFALAVIVLGIAVCAFADRNFRHEQARTLAPEAARVLREYTEGGLSDLTASIDKRERRPNNNFSYAVIARDGRQLAGSTALAQVGPGIHSTTIMRRGEPPQQGLVLGTALGAEAVFYVIIDSEELEKFEQQILLLFGGGVVVIGMMGVGGALLLGGYLKRRLDGILVTARAIRAGDLAQRVAVGTRDDEFDRVGLSLNTMLDRIDTLVTNLRQLSSDVAHDMRTPLSRLRGEIEAGLAAGVDTDTQHRALERALERSDAMLVLFGAILRVAEVEGQSSADFSAEIDLAALAETVCDMYRPAVEDGGRCLSSERRAAPHVRGNRELLIQAISNLLDNAQSHTSPGTAIAVTIGRSGQDAWVAVADDGPGVAAVDRPRIAERFVRLDKGRSGPGHGLGLNLVATIVSAHGGDLRIEDNAPGLRVIIVLPEAAPQSATDPSYTL